MAGKFELGDRQAEKTSEEFPSTLDEFRIKKFTTAGNHQELVRAFELFLVEKKPISEIRDTSELPFPKTDILGAITEEIKGSEDGNRIQHLKALAAFLADFQDDVGSHPLTLMGISDVNFLKLRYRCDDNFPDPMGVIERNPDKDRYRAFKNLCDRELVYIANHLATAGSRRPTTGGYNAFAQCMPITV